MIKSVQNIDDTPNDVFDDGLLDQYVKPKGIEATEYLKGKKISDFTKNKPGSRFWKSLKLTLAGQTTVGLIGREIKNVVKHFVPFGKYADAALDQIGDSLKPKTTNTMDKPKLLSKTVWSAIIIALTALLQAFGVDLTADPELTVHIYETVYGLAGAFGLYGLRDAISKQINTQ